MQLKHLLCLALIISVSLSLYAQPTQLSTEQKQKIDQLFNAFDRSDSPGYAVGVFYKDQPLYTKGYGMADLDHDIAITDTTVFNVASITKQFTGACIAQLILDGKINLEDPLSKYFPEVKKYPYEIKLKTPDLYDQWIKGILSFTPTNRLALESLSLFYG